jgi:hypothetical protein
MRKQREKEIKKKEMRRDKEREKKIEQKERNENR